MPAAHKVHARLLVAESTDEKVPATQFPHCDAPLADHVPDEQLEQANALVAPCPDEAVPGKQGKHARADVAAIVVEYVPALQFVQLGLETVDQEPDKQAEHELAPKDEKSPALHDIHDCIDEAPATDENKPPKHGWQDDTEDAPNTGE